MLGEVAFSDSTERPCPIAGSRGSLLINGIIPFSNGAAHGIGA